MAALDDPSKPVDSHAASGEGSPGEPSPSGTTELAAAGDQADGTGTGETPPGQSLGDGSEQQLSEAGKTPDDQSGAPSGTETAAAPFGETETGTDEGTSGDTPDVAARDTASKEAEGTGSEQQLSEAGKTPDDQSGAPSGTETAAAPSGETETGADEGTSGDAPDVAARDSASTGAEGTDSEQLAQVAVTSPDDRTGDAAKAGETASDTGQIAEQVAERTGTPEGDPSQPTPEPTFSTEDRRKAAEAFDKFKKGEVLTEDQQELLERVFAKVVKGKRSAAALAAEAEHKDAVAKDIRVTADETGENRLGLFYKVATWGNFAAHVVREGSKVVLETASFAGKPAATVAKVSKHAILTTQDLTSKPLIETAENVALRGASYLPEPLADRVAAGVESFKAGRQFRELSKLDPDSPEYDAKLRKIRDEKHLKLARRNCRRAKWIKYGEKACSWAFTARSAVSNVRKAWAELPENLALGKSLNQMTDAATQDLRKRAKELEDAARFDRLKSELALCRDGDARCPFPSTSPSRPEWPLT